MRGNLSLRANAVGRAVIEQRLASGDSGTHTTQSHE